jgi:hypothetical protein
MDQFCAACSFLPITCSLNPSSNVDDRGGKDPVVTSTDGTTSGSVNPADGASTVTNPVDSGNPASAYVNPQGVSASTGASTLNPSSSATTIVPLSSTKVDSKSNSMLGGSKLGIAENPGMNEQYGPGIYIYIYLHMYVCTFNNHTYTYFCIHVYMHVYIHV